MMLTAKEINTYNKLADNGFVQKITCPFDESDTIVTKIDSNDDPFFHCLWCNSSFTPSKNIEILIKKHIYNN